MRKTWFKKASIDELVRAYAEAAEAAGRARKVGDYKTNNRNVDIIIKIRAELRLRGQEALLALLPLLDHEYSAVRSAAAVDLLEVAPEQGVRVLEEIESVRPSIFGLEAEYALKEYRNRAGRFSHIPR